MKGRDSAGLQMLRGRWSAPQQVEAGERSPSSLEQEQGDLPEHVSLEPGCDKQQGGGSPRRGNCVGKGRSRQGPVCSLEQKFRAAGFRGSAEAVPRGTRALEPSEERWKASREASDTSQLHLGGALRLGSARALGGKGDS